MRKMPKPVIYIILAVALAALALFMGHWVLPAQAFNLAFFTLLCTALMMEMTQPRTIDPSGLDYK